MPQLTQFFALTQSGSTYRVAVPEQERGSMVFRVTDGGYVPIMGDGGDVVRIDVRGLMYGLRAEGGPVYRPGNHTSAVVGLFLDEQGVRFCRGKLAAGDGHSFLRVMTKLAIDAIGKSHPHFILTEEFLRKYSE